MGLTRRKFVSQVTVGLTGLPFVRWSSWAQTQKPEGTLYEQRTDANSTLERL